MLNSTAAIPNWDIYDFPIGEAVLVIRRGDEQLIVSSPTDFSTEELQQALSEGDILGYWLGTVDRVEANVGFIEPDEGEV